MCALIRLSADKINENEVLLKLYQQRLTRQPQVKLKDIEAPKLADIRERLSRLLEYQLKVQSTTVQRIAEAIQLVEPRNTLRRGYSISRHNGQAIKDSKELKIGDEIESTLFKGKVISEVKRIENE
jgi:exodeoxyribonuclease VII large subunit